MPAVNRGAVESPAGGKSTAGAAAAQRPPSADFCIGPTHEESPPTCATRDPQATAATPCILPDPDQVPRRDPAALRCHARARVHDEGRLLVPRRLRRPAARNTENMYDTYMRIFTRLGLKIPGSRADPGAIGGTGSKGVPRVGPSPGRMRSPTARNPTTRRTSSWRKLFALQWRAKALPPPDEKGPRPARPLRDVANLLGVPIEKTVKAIAVIREQARDGIGSFAMLLVRGDHDLNELKARK